MINLMNDGGRIASKLDRMAVISKPIQAKGIQNTGAICYASSAAQMLFRIDGIRNFILNLSDNLKLPPQELKPILGLKKLFKALDTPGVKVVKGHGGEFIPAQFPRGQQGDAEEFFSTWVETLKNMMGTDLNSELFLKVSLNRTRTHENNTSTSETSSDFWPAIDINFPESTIAQNRPINLDLLLSDTNGPFGAEILTNELKQEYKITMIPKFVTLNFIRTAYNPSTGPAKISAPVQIPEILNLSSYMQNSTTPLTHLRLKMFVLHLGSSSSGGHYVAYVRDSGEIWQLLDDERVSQVSQIQALEKAKLSSICIYKQE